MRIFELRQKEVINISDGCRFGFISDVIFDHEKGHIDKLIIPGPGKIFGVFGREQEYHVPWDCVKKIGDDITLVDVDIDDATEDV